MLKRILKGFGYVLGGYLLIALIASLIPVSKEPAAEEVGIYLLSNGVHLDIVVPIQNDIHDWRTALPVEHTAGGDRGYTYVALGWGNKEFYLNTPTWGDLQASIVFKAITGLSNAAIHATFYQQLKEGERCKKMMLSKAQYQQLCAFLQKRFVLNEQGLPAKIDAKGYWHNDAFYAATGNYSALYTCNTWANEALKACGQKASLWTPFAAGVMWHY